jgi:hypothetical protein
MKTHNKLFMPCLVASIIACAAQPGLADNISGEGWYAGLSGDLTWPNRADMGWGGRVNLGYQTAPTSTGDFRVEGEAAYHAADGDSGAGDLHYFNYMGNAYYDFANWSESSWRIRPYVGGGLGVASVRRGKSGFSATFDNHTNLFAYQGMAGLSFAADQSRKTEWLVGYRYHGTEKTEGVKTHAHNMEIGLRYHF